VILEYSRVYLGRIETVDWVERVVETEGRELSAGNNNAV
jgi:hypothetical protein